MSALLRWQLGMGFVCLLFSTTALSAVEVSPPLENKLTQALKKKIAVNFREAPLEDVIKELAKQATIPCQIDNVSLQDEGIDLQHPVTFITGHQEIAASLAEILHPLGLAFDTSGETLTVLSAGKSEEVLSDRAFDVSQLVELIKPRLLPLEVRVPEDCHNLQRGFGAVDPDVVPDGQRIVAMQFGDGAGGFGKASDPKSPFRVVLEPAQHRFPAEYCLQLLVQDNTSGQWQDVDCVGGAIAPSLGRLRIRNTDRVHQEAFKILSSLEMFLREPRKYSPMRLGDDNEDRRLRAAFNEVLDTISAAPEQTIPLQKWMEDNFRDRGLAFRVDQAVLLDEGIDWNAVTIKLIPGVTRRKLLLHALQQADLSIVYEDRKFTITSLVKADECLTTMIHDVSDIPEAGDMDWLAECLYSQTSGQWEQIDGVGGTASTCGISGLLFVRQTEQVQDETTTLLNDLRKPLAVAAKPLQPQRMRSIYTLPDVPTATDLQTVLPKLVDLPDATWPEDAIQRVGSLLVVEQTEFVHRRIEKVVAAIRQAHAVPVPQVPPPGPPNE